MPYPFTTTEKREAIERELGYRRRVYVRRVMNKQMTQELADRQIAVFEAILADYVEMEKRDRLI
jgi:type IV secretory pathway TrbD component